MEKPKEPPKVVIWGNHSGMINWLTQALLKEASVVERVRLQQVLDEQQIRLTHTADDEADILRVGKILGADRILFAEATIRPEHSSGTVITPKFGGGSYSRTMYHLSVSLRMVKVETAQVRYSGTASYTLPVSDNPDTGIEILTQFAITRAVCPLEDGYTWVEDDGLINPSTAGCHPPGK
jgi:curli biogenesis system outer membrane secretion channel CsgG